MSFFKLTNTILDVVFVTVVIVVAVTFLKLPKDFHLERDLDMS